VREPFNLWLLYSQAEAYKTRPSALLGLETPWSAWQIDQLVFIEGRRLEKALTDGKNPFNTRQKPLQGQFADPRKFRKARKAKLKPDGTF
jgi:hypothetical protein